MISIREDYVLEKHCKHSWRYKPKRNGGKLNGMTIYLPKIAVKGDDAPKEITVTVEVPE